MFGQGAKVREFKSWKDEFPAPSSIPGLEQVFEAFCTFGGGEAGMLDSAKFNKLAKECSLIDKKVNSNSIGACACVYVFLLTTIVD